MKPVAGKVQYVLDTKVDGQITNSGARLGVVNEIVRPVERAVWDIVRYGVFLHVRVEE